MLHDESCWVFYLNHPQLSPRKQLAPAYPTSALKYKHLQLISICLQFITCFFCFVLVLFFYRAESRLLVRGHGDHKPQCNSLSTAAILFLPAVCLSACVAVPAVGSETVSAFRKCWSVLLPNGKSPFFFLMYLTWNDQTVQSKALWFLHMNDFIRNISQTGCSTDSTSHKHWSKRVDYQRTSVSDCVVVVPKESTTRTENVSL